MFESTSVFGWRHFLNSDSSNGVLCALLFLAATGAIIVSSLAIHYTHEETVCLTVCRQEPQALLTEIQILGLFCGIFAVINATVSTVQIFRPVFKSRTILCVISWILVVFWLFVVVVWGRRALTLATERRWTWVLGATYISNLVFSLVAGCVNTFIFRYHKKRDPALFDDESDLVDSHRGNLPSTA